MRRYARARDMAMVLENSVELARASAVGEWVTMLGEEQLGERARLVGDIEAHKSRVVTSVLSQQFERPDGFPTVVEAGSGHNRSQRRNKWFIMGGAAAVTVAALSVVAAKPSLRAALASAIGRPTRVVHPEPPPPAPERPTAATAPVAAFPDPPDPPLTAAPPPAAPPPTTSEKHSSVSTSSTGSKANRAAAAAQKAARAKAAACDPPYTIDAEGVKIYKTECFQK
jgi:serine/threonine-protein kinase